MPRIPVHPGLYPTEGDNPPLRGARCASCGHVFFPLQRYGCEACGATGDQTEEVDLAGAGSLHAFATVHRHHGDGIETPFTLAEIVLDGGPTIRATLTCPTDDGLQLNDRVRSVLVPVGDDPQGNERVELRFDPQPRREGS